MIRFILSLFRSNPTKLLNGGLNCNHFYDAEYRNVAIYVESRV